MLRGPVFDDPRPSRPLLRASPRRASSSNMSSISGFNRLGLERRLLCGQGRARHHDDGARTRASGRKSGSCACRRARVNTDFVAGARPPPNWRRSRRRRRSSASSSPKTWRAANPVLRHAPEGHDRPPSSSRTAGASSTRLQSWSHFRHQSAIHMAAHDCRTPARMSESNETHDPARKSWVASANAPRFAIFPIQNLPFGAFSGAPRRFGAHHRRRDRRPDFRGRRRRILF